MDNVTVLITILVLKLKYDVISNVKRSGSNLSTCYYPNYSQSDNATEFRHWVKIRVVVLLFIAPIVCLHAYIHYGVLEIFVICVVATYQIYYVWVVQYYAYELDIELESDSTGIGDGSAGGVTGSKAC